MNKKTISALGLTLALILLGTGAAWAGSSANYAINWQVVSGGGQVATANNITLQGSIGQPLIGDAGASGGAISLASGYWEKAAVEGNGILYLPLIFKAATSGGTSNQPDLAIEALAATSSQVTVTIRNAGNSSVVDSFWVDVYFNPTQTPALNQPWNTIAPAGAVWGVTKTLSPGESLVLTTGGDYYFGSSSSATFPVGAAVYAYVDSVNHNTTYGNVQESNEGNNLSGPVVSTAGLAGAADTSNGPVSTEGLPDRN